MGTYNNPFDPHEDAMLSELHEIRHELHPMLSQTTVDEINADALKKYQQWQEIPDREESIDLPSAVSSNVTAHA